MSPTWQKSSYSEGYEEADCVEVSFTQDVHVRDSKNNDGPQLAFSPTAWRAFLER